MNISKSMHLLGTILPGSIFKAEIYQGSLPVWLKRAAVYYIVQTESVKICLILPKEGLEYEALVRVQKQAGKIFKCLSLLIADNLSPKYRSVFVKNKVPFIYKKESIFAPELGVKISKLKDVRLFLKPTAEPAPLSPFELKILAGYLTDQIPLNKFNLDNFKEFLMKKGYQCSKTKISSTLSNLVRRDLLSVFGKGPLRRLQFNSKKKVWETLSKCKIKEMSKIVHGEYSTQGKSFVCTNESALSKFSMLAPPDKEYYGLTKKQYELIKIKGSGICHAGNPMFFYEIRKEDPALFSVKGCLNPIEVYFTLRDHHDERIQMAIQEMLKAIGIEVEGDE